MCCTFSQDKGYRLYDNHIATNNYFQFSHQLLVFSISLRKCLISVPHPNQNHKTFLSQDLYFRSYCPSKISLTCKLFLNKNFINVMQNENVWFTTGVAINFEKPDRIEPNRIDNLKNLIGSTISKTWSDRTWSDRQF